ncbi:hypothetical protein ATKI12_0468 [Kitasatospora sp. Ki12]
MPRHPSTSRLGVPAVLARAVIATIRDGRRRACLVRGSS